MQPHASFNICCAAVAICLLCCVSAASAWIQFSTPSPCQVTEVEAKQDGTFDTKTTISYEFLEIDNFGCHRAKLRLNAGEEEVPINHASLVVPSLSLGGHVLSMICLDEQGQQIRRSELIPFAIIQAGSSASDAFVQFSRHSSNAGYDDEALSLLRCAFQHTPTIGIANMVVETLVALGQYSEAASLSHSVYVSASRSRESNDDAQETYVQTAVYHAVIEYLKEAVEQRGEEYLSFDSLVSQTLSTGSSRPVCDPNATQSFPYRRFEHNSPCKNDDARTSFAGVELETFEQKLVQSFVALFDEGVKTLTMHHTYLSLFRLSSTAKTAITSRLEYLQIHAERLHLKGIHTQRMTELTASSDSKMLPSVAIASQFRLHSCHAQEIGRKLSPRKKTVVIYIRQVLEEMNEPWGPSSLHTGIGGAGEAVIFLAKELATQGYHVEVFGNPVGKDVGVDEYGVLWLPWYTYDESCSPDAFIVWWHHIDSIAIGAAAKYRIIWLHYGQYLDRWPLEAVNAVDKIVPLSKYHASQLPDYAQSKITVSANGINPSLLKDGRNEHLNLIYASHPFYGLEVLLEIWPKIHNAIPNATLNVYYGFTPGVLRFLKTHPKGEEFRVKMTGLLEQDGIVYHGLVGAEDLADAVASSGFYIYPCTISEISSISLMRAQALGSIPITSRYLDSALPETSQFDMGPRAREGNIRDDKEWQDEWVQAVIDAVNTPESDLEDYRNNMKKWAREQFDWLHVGKQWSDWIEQES